MIIGLLVFFVILIHLLLQPTAFIRDMDHRLNSLGYNLRFSFDNPTESEFGSVHIRIDESSFPSNLSKYPIDRLWLAELIEKVSRQKPKLIILNLILDRPTNYEDDQALARALKAADNIVIRESSRYPTLPLFKNSVKGAGILKLKEDSTATIQMVCNSIDTCGKKEILHHYVWKSLHPEEPYFMTFPDNGWLRVNYNLPSFKDTEKKYITASELQEGSSTFLKDKIVFIGKQFEPFAPNYKTPITRSQHDLFTENEIIEQIVMMLFSKDLLIRISPMLGTILLCISLCLLGYAAIRRSYLVYLLLWMGFFIGWIFISTYCFAFYNTDIPFFLPIIELNLFSIITLYVSINWEKIQNLQNALSLEKKNLSLKEARIEYLTTQMNTHNVFNEFSRIKGMIATDPEKAKSYLVSFSNMLRYSLLYGDKSHTPLDKHLEFIRYYLSQQETVDSRFQFNLIANNNNHDIQLPWNTLFTLVENAVKYAEALDRDKHHTIDINISMAINTNMILFAVQNPYDEDVTVESTKVGIKNLKERLEFFYTNKPFSLEFIKEGSTWTSQLSLPL